MTSKTDIHPEYDTPTPQNIDEWSEDQLDAYNAAQRESLDAALDDEVELSPAEQAVADELQALADERAGQHSVELSDDVTLTVQAEMPGWALERVQSINENETWGDVVEDIAEVFCGVEADAEKRGIIIGPPEYTNSRVWRKVATMHGPAFLFDVFEEVMEPLQERVESIDGFRQK